LVIKILLNDGWKFLDKDLSHVQKIRFDDQHENQELQRSQHQERHDQKFHMLAKRFINIVSQLNKDLKSNSDW
jgi:hypothetical protein